MSGIARPPIERGGELRSWRLRPALELLDQGIPFRPEVRGLLDR